VESTPKFTEDLRSSARNKTNHLPINLIGNDIRHIPVRLTNVSLGGFQIMCSNYVAQQFLKPKFSVDNQHPESVNIVVEILDKDDSKTFALNCKIVYIHENHTPSDYCSNAAGLELMIDNPKKRRALSRLIEKYA
jgi:hypothetical protein